MEDSRQFVPDADKEAADLLDAVDGIMVDYPFQGDDQVLNPPQVPVGTPPPGLIPGA